MPARGVRRRASRHLRGIGGGRSISLPLMQQTRGSPFANRRPISIVERCQDNPYIMDDLHVEHAGATKQALCSDLWAIVYVSKAARPVTRDDLAHLLEGAQRRNVEEGITGILLYADGYFMQYLEGPKAGLHRVYVVIKTHPLHYGLIDLVREPIQTREFAEWSMACHVVGAGGESPLSGHYDLLASRLNAAVRTKSEACRLLSHFWTAGRESVAPALQEHRETLARRGLSASPDSST